MTEFWGLLGTKLAAGFTQAHAPAISPWEVLIVLLGAGALCLPALWRYAGLFTTLVHELGHAGAAISAGRFVTGMRIQRDHSGETSHYGLVGARTVWAAFWGYPVPAVAGGALVWASLAGWAQLAFSAGGVLVLLALLAIRNRFGAAVILVAVAVAATFVWIGDPQISAHATLVLGAALLVGSLRSFGSLLTVHAKHPESLESSDAHMLALETGVPSGIWLALFGTAIASSWYVTAVAAVPLLHLAG